MLSKLGIDCTYMGHDLAVVKESTLMLGQYYLYISMKCNLLRVGWNKILGK